jgi:hypothetical protein
MLARMSAHLWWIGLILELAVLTIAWIECAGDNTHFFQAAARLSGRVSLLYFGFIVVFATYNPGFLYGSPVWRAKWRLYASFALVHVIHWCLLAVAVTLSGFELQPIRVAGGALAYGLVVGMPIILYFDLLSANTLVRIQSFYIFWVWLIFFLTYVTRLRGQTTTHTGSPSAWWVLVIITSGLMAWRTYRIVTRKSAT